jgi:pimeloyl-ACP methyl ester carboxylesterase
MICYFLPGLVCDESVWAPQVEALADLCEPRIPRYADCTSLVAMAEATLKGAPARFAVIGHSMGGRVALEVFRLAASRVTHLGLLDTAAEPPAASEAAKRKPLLDIARADGMPAFARAWLADMVHPDRLADAAFMARLCRMVERHTYRQYEGQIQALLARPDAGPLLRTIRCPTLVLCGRQDTWRTPEQHADMAAEIAGATLEIIEHCGHMTTLEAPHAVNAALRKLLQS